MEIRYSRVFIDTDEKRAQISDINNDIIMKGLENISPFLNSIEIETVNRCNNDCSFCPVNINADIREYKKMDDELFYSIIEELDQMDYIGYISLFSNNEPLIDSRIYDYVDYAVGKLPNAIHAMFTNGKLLNKERFNRLISSLDLLFIDNYNDSVDLNDNIRELVENYRVESNECEVIVLVRKKNQVLLNRGGLAPNKKTYEIYKSPCFLPYMQMVIRPDGKVSRCCQDAYGNETFGSVATEGIGGVWNNSNYKRIREMMISGERSRIGNCGVCDEIGLINYYPKQWGEEMIRSFFRIIDSVKGRICLINPSRRLVNLFRKSRVDFEASEDLLNESGYYYVIEDYCKSIIDKCEKKGLQVGENYLVFESHWLRTHIEKKDYKEARRKMNSILINNTPCVIFGCGGLAERIYNEYRANYLYCIDNDKNIKRFHELDVISPEEFDENNMIYVIIGVNDYDEPVKQMMNMGISLDRIVKGANLYLE